MLIDTHCHLHDREFFSEEQAEEMLKRAHEKGVHGRTRKAMLASGRRVYSGKYRGRVRKYREAFDVVESGYGDYTDARYFMFWRGGSLERAVHGIV